MKRIDIALAAGLIITIFVTSFTSFAKDCEEVRQNVVRLHILANSDSEADQQLKLNVRDRILAETDGLFSSVHTKEQAENAAKKHLDLIEAAARDEITRRGYNYPVKAELVGMFFETRTYDEATLPAGRYDAVRVSIGEAGGKNWWCVMFPPMCIPAASEKLPLEEQITRLGQQPRYVPKLAALELFEALTEDKKDNIMSN